MFGGGDRTAVLRRLVPDLLPDAVLSRTSKAAFNDAYLAGHTREFARTWDGTGVDESLVDAEALRRAWLAEWPVAGDDGAAAAGLAGERRDTSSALDP